MYRLFIDGGADASMSPAVFLRPAFGEFARRAASLPRLLAGATIGCLRGPRRRGFLESFAALGAALPTGVFDQRALDVFLRRLFSTAGRVNDFRELRHTLFIIATSLDAGESVAFGGPGLDHVPISKAIEASAALPGLFPPVEIDGEHYVDGALNKTLHASIVLEQGVDLLLCVNPLVPFDAHSASRLHRSAVKKLNHGGLPIVLGQTFRAIVHSRMQAGMDRYERQYPGADIVLFEPEREDADMFFASIFSYAHRKSLCEVAYRSTRRSLLARRTALEPLFRKHGIRLHRARLRDETRSIDSALTDHRPLVIGALAVRGTARDLSHTLDHLERWLAAQK
jgi:NTE family protein